MGIEINLKKLILIQGFLSIHPGTNLFDNGDSWPPRRSMAHRVNVLAP